MIFRKMQENEYDLLKDFLYEAIFIPEGALPPEKDIINQPEHKLYYEDFGVFKSIVSGKDNLQEFLDLILEAEFEKRYIIHFGI
ncbi:hypothetical protein [Butyrivibrio sp. AC2005]|uniref:hypothetical protein n=1 Tax=Butyrivibrio sp. AC2005 TaxID=1280672 RepID=UPI00047B0FA9|nr:hypothetical protein [Butyrivibrio sp. AC2005]